MPASARTALDLQDVWTLIRATAGVSHSATAIWSQSRPNGSPQFSLSTGHVVVSREHGLRE